MSALVSGHCRDSICDRLIPIIDQLETRDYSFLFFFFCVLVFVLLVDTAAVVEVFGFACEMLPSLSGVTVLKSICDGWELLTVYRFV